jgi:hypothetical protein
MKLAAFAVAAAFAGPSVAASDNEPNSFQIQALSSQPHLVSGGNALVRIDVPARVALAAARVTLNGANVTSMFTPDAASHSMTGLVSGLVDGENTLEASGGGNGGPSKRLVLTNYPITGPMISGPHEVPFFCQTHQFNLPTTGGNLGPALDADCSIATRVDYVYSANGTSFRPLNTALPPPPDVVTTTTNAGATVRFIVRVETGTVTARSTRSPCCTIHTWSPRRAGSSAAPAGTAS